MRKLICSSFLILAMFIPTLPAVNSAVENEKPSFDEKHRQAVSKSPEDIVFTIKLKSNKKKFYLGELVPLECSISCTAPGSAGVYNFHSVRSITAGNVTYHITPTDLVVDPLCEYNHSNPHFLHAISWTVINFKISEKPITFPVFLNSKLRFDKPGIFKLYTDLKIEKGDPFQPRQPGIDYRITVTSSNTLEFELIPPDPIWLQKTIKNAVFTIESNYAHLQSKVSDACFALRSLYTKEAANEIIRLLGTVNDSKASKIVLGLAGSPHQEYIVAEMERSLVATDYPVTNRFMEMLMRLKWMTVKSKKKPEAINEKQEQKVKRITSFRDKEFEKYADATWKQLAANVLKKKGKALAVSLDTLIVRNGASKDFDDSLEYQALIEIFPTLLPALFHELPQSTQERLLIYHWRYIASPAMLPVLRKMISTPPLEKTFSKSSDIAVKRLYELAPEEGRQIILAEIKKPRLNLLIESLGILPEKTLPEFDEIFVNNLTEEKSDTICYLIKRYASPAIYPRIKRIYQANQDKFNGGKADIAVIAYLMRNDPAYGAQSIREILARQSYIGQDNILEWVASYNMYPELEEIAIECLDDPRPDIVSGALRMLKRHGSARVEDVLWQRYRQLHEKWKYRLNEFKPTNKLSNNHDKHENQLFGALVEGYGWHIDIQKLKELKKLSMKDSVRKRADRIMDDLSKPPSIGIWMNNEKIFFRVGYCNEFVLEDIKKN